MHVSAQERPAQTLITPARIDDELNFDMTGCFTVVEFEKNALKVGAMAKV
jgi:hypothetical protein